jgi:hypothetical protein
MDEAYYVEDGVLINDVRLGHQMRWNNPKPVIILASNSCHSGII